MNTKHIFRHFLFLNGENYGDATISCLNFVNGYTPAGMLHECFNFGLTPSVLFCFFCVSVGVTPALSPSPPSWLSFQGLANLSSQRWCSERNCCERCSHAALPRRQINGMAAYYLWGCGVFERGPVRPTVTVM